MEYEYDPVKSAANREKHGVDFESARALWAAFGATMALSFPSEQRWLRIAVMNEKHWSAIFTVRSGTIRLISVRRARKDEIAAYEQAKQSAGKYDNQP